MHHIQRKILNLLMHSPSLQYAQMRPKGVESNHFAYHLDQLVRNKLIIKENRKYSLTSGGLALADRVSHASMTPRIQPHIVTTICVTNDQGETLLFEHMFQPYLNTVGFPQGRMHFEETTAQAAARELAEKTGLVDVILEHRGIAYIHAQKDQQTISKILSHVFTGIVSGQPYAAVQDPTKGRAFWGNIADYTPKNTMPGFLAIAQRLQSAHSLFFEEITEQL
ncbi:MAG TPA: NUDIX hydrolase [Candidatus Saccharimonadales bacterium]|nr:NUDIX hydrolase [Candidatus Saccharimonadales bacterium]